MAPENNSLEKGDSYWKPSFLGAMLVSGSVGFRFFFRYLLKFGMEIFHQDYLGCPRNLVNDF